MALVDVVAGITGAPIVVEVVTEVTVRGPIYPTSALIGVVLIDLFLDGMEVVALRSIRLTAQVMARQGCGRLGRHTLLLHQGRGNPKVVHGYFSFEREVGLLKMCHRNAQVGLRAAERG
jgi:hypothetical protein